MWPLAAKDAVSVLPACMADSAAHLVDEVLSRRPIRQWVLSVPFQLRYLFVTDPQAIESCADHRAPGNSVPFRSKGQE